MNASTSQRGAVLIVALVFMLIISVLGVASMRNATMQERMAGNNKDINIAFQAAEAAVREAEAAMDALASIDFDGSNGLYLSCPDTTDTRTACCRKSRGPVVRRRLQSPPAASSGGAEFAGIAEPDTDTDTDFGHATDTDTDAESHTDG